MYVNNKRSTHQRDEMESSARDWRIEQVDFKDENVADFEVSPMLSIEFTKKENEIELFLYHVHEEDRKVFLFCKQVLESMCFTVCVQVTNPFYYLQFLPIPGHEFEIVDEVKEVAHRIGGYMVRFEMKEMNYAFNDITVPKTAEYCCVIFSSGCNLAKIRPKGQHYSNVFGVSANLTENLFVRRKIYGPSWIKVKNVSKKKRISTVPMLMVNDFESIIPIERDNIPPLNIGIIAMRTLFHSQEIFMISLRILNHWNINDFVGTGTKSLNLISTDIKDLTDDKNILIYKNEYELLHGFCNLIDKFDIDILCSYGLTMFHLPNLLKRMKENDVDQWWKIGRLKRLVSPYFDKFNITMSLSGRIPCDVSICCQKSISAKSNDLSAAVQTEFGFYRQQIDHLELTEELKDPKQLLNLIKYNSRDTLFVAQLLNALEILPLCFHFSQISGCLLARVMLGHPSFRCESLFLKYFHENGFVIPDKVIAKYKKESAFPGGMVLQPKRGFYETCILCLDFSSLYPSIIIEYNICFTTVDINNPSKRINNNHKGILPQMMEDLLNERGKIKNEMKELNSKLLKIEEELNKIQDKLSEINTQNENKENTNLFSTNFISKNQNYFINSLEIYSQLSEQKTDLQKRKLEIQLELQRLNTKQLAFKSLANSTYGYLGFKRSRFLSCKIA